MFHILIETLTILQYDATELQQTEASWPIYFLNNLLRRSPELSRTTS